MDTYAKNNVAFDASTFEGTFDPYVLDIQDGVITILGESSDGAYYGIVSLMHILNQIDGKRVRNLTMPIRRLVVLSKDIMVFLGAMRIVWR